MKHTIKTLIGLVMLWPLLWSLHATAQVTPTPGLEDVDDVILLETGGETVALVSPHSVRTLGLSSQTSFTNENTLPLGGYLSGTVQGVPTDKVYFFSTGFEHINTSGTLEILSTHNQGHLLFGALAPERQVSGFTASQEAFINQIDLTWAVVPGAEGYIIFREDVGFTRPLAVLAGEQQTTYSDLGLTVDKSYTYYILAFSLADGDLFLNTATHVTGKTKPFGFIASSDNEARVTFTYEFDNHLLVGLENQAAYIEVLDVTNGANTLMYGDELTLTDITEQALLFDNSIILHGEGNNGIGATTDLGALPTWSAELWINPSYTEKYHPVLSDEKHVFALMPDGRFLYNELGTGIYYSKGDEIVWDDWNHLALTFDGSTLRIYHNGEPVIMEDVRNGGFQTEIMNHNFGLSSVLQFGRVKDIAIPAAITEQKDALGMIRMWNKARTADQIVADYKDIYDRPASGLLAQWTFDNQTLSLADDIHGRTLTINTTDDATFPIRWSPSFAFVNPKVNKSVSVWLEQPLPTGTDRQYQITMYETGTGRTISRRTHAHTFTHPGSPAVSAVVRTGSPYAVDLAISPKSRHADKYLIRRHEDDEVTLVGAVFPEKTGDTYSLAPLAFTDAFAHPSANSIAGGKSYSWSATPVYSALERAFQDEDHQGALAEALPTLDYLTQVQPLASGQGIALNWDAALLASVDYDTVQIERNGKLIATVSAAQATYTDTLMLFGQDYTYGVLPLKNGAPALAQTRKGGLAPNGTASGTLVTKKGNYVLPNHPLALTNATQGITVRKVSSDAFGAVAETGLDYGSQTDFAWTSAASTVLKDHTFTLTRLAPEATTPFILYDSVVADEKDAALLTGLQAKENTVANAIFLTWEATPTYNHADHPIFTNVYRNKVLVEILVNATEYIDYQAPAGTHEYRIVSYYYGEDQTLVYQQHQDLEAVNTPGLTPGSKFMATATAEHSMAISWEYPPTAALASFQINRINEATQQTTSVARVPFQSDTDAYQLLDGRGYPGAQYTYQLVAHTLAGETQVLAEQTATTYPMIAVTDLSQVQQAQNAGANPGALVQLEVATDKQAWPAWDGFMLVDPQQALPINKAVFTNTTAGTHTYTLYQPNVRASAGQLAVAVYKHTDEGLFVSATEGLAYSGATVATPFALPTPSAPALTTGSPDIQVPVMAASKDAQGRIFVQWEYPEYTDVTFHLSWKAAENSQWNTVVLPNEQRAFLHEDLSSQVVVYKLFAEYEDGRRSSQTWDFGIANFYRSVEGRVYNAHNMPQPHVMVGLMGHWTQTDSAGFYRIADLEVPNPDQTLQYVAPGAQSLRTLPVSFATTSQEVAQNIFVETTNELAPIQPAFAAVFGLSDIANPNTLTNEVRWSITGKQFTGVKVYRGSNENEVADIRQGEPMLYVDSLTENNPVSALYAVRPYFINALDQQVYLDAGSKTTAGLDYPPLEAPTYAYALADQALGVVSLSWAHPRNNIDGYIITRNDEEIGRIAHDASHRFVDTTGLPSVVYRYAIYGYVDRAGSTVISQLPIALDALYPAPGNPVAPRAQIALVAETTGEDNAVDISWTYPTAVSYDGVVLFRGLDSVASVPYPQTSIIDSLGLPETYTTYTVRTYDLKEGRWFSSIGDTANTIFPALRVPELTLAPVNFDTLWVKWNYIAAGVDAFELTLVNEDTDETVVSEVIQHTQAEYAYLFDRALAGRSYRIQVRALAYRNAQTYYSALATQTYTHEALPEPTLAVGYANGSQQAALGWEMSTERNDGFFLTIKKDGAIYTGPSPVDGSSLRYENQPLAPLQREFLFVPGVSDLDGGATFTFELTAHQNAQGGLSTTVSAEQLMILTTPNKHPRNFVATDNGVHSVHLHWEAPVEDGNLKRYALYRDGEKVTNLNADVLTFEDLNIAPGVSHVYQVAAVFQNKEYSVTTRGGVRGDGVITAQILTKQGGAVPGDSLRIQASVNGIPYEAISYADAKGKVYFRELAYGTPGIAYSISPAGNPVHYDLATTQMTLSQSLTQGFAGVYIHQRKRIIEGTISNAYCQTGCGRDSVEVLLYATDLEQKRKLVTSRKTDHRGSFSFAIPFYLDDVVQYELEVSNRAVNDADEDIVPYRFYYREGPQMSARAADSTLVVPFPVADLLAQEVHRVKILEETHHPLRVEVKGPGNCDVFAGYEFTLRIRDTKGKIDLRIETQNRQITEILPPYDYEVSVLDVNKPDAFSASILDYFRSRSLRINNEEHYARFLDPEQEEDANLIHSLRYNERASLSIAGLENVLDGTCNTYVMHTEEQVLLNVAPRQVINGLACDVTSGYILVKFGGGEATDSNNDTLEFVDGKWESVIITATTPNLVLPYTQLLEFYYYDANGNYQGATSEEILVTGDRQNPGSDVFVIVDEAVPVPLYVLRDPPGDQSYSSISASSDMSIKLENSYRGSLAGGYTRSFMTRVFGLETTTKLSGETELAGNRSQSQTYKLEFTDGLSTLKNPELSENLQGYLDGRDADIIVGMDVILAYGLTEVLSFESCVPTKSRTIGVNPTEISSIWNYTRSQIENTIRYYKEVTDEDGSFTVESLNEAQASSEEIVEDLANSYLSFERLLAEVDTRFTPICEMCNYIRDYREPLVKLGEEVRLARQVKAFCNSQGLNGGGACSDTPIETLLKGWDESVREDYRNAYRAYMSLREYDRFYASYDLGGAVSLDRDRDLIGNSQFFNPLENLTFGAGSQVTRSFGTTASGDGGRKIELSASFEFKLTQKAIVKFQVATWFGFGGGTQIVTGKTKAKSNITREIFVKTKQSRTSGATTSESNGFSYSFTLDDNDDGDHFSVDVLHSGTYGDSKIGPYFSVVGGRSSCPYEPGTISRDQPSVQLVDEQGNLMPTQYFDLDPGVPFELPLAVASGNPFGENRLLTVLAPLGSNKSGLKMDAENIGLSSLRGPTMFVAPDTLYQTTLYVSQGNRTHYDFEDIQILVKPTCPAGAITYFEAPHVMDTLHLAFHFRKPISPISIESDMGNWFVMDDPETDSEAAIFKLKNYDVEQGKHSMSEIVMEYKRVNDAVWTPMKDATLELESLAVDTLLHFFQQKRNTYPEPTYPFVWNLPDNTVDGRYQIRATLFHENGSFAYSNILTGTVDRTAPRVASLSPADGLLSQTDKLAISFTEGLDCETFLAGDHVTIKVLANAIQEEVIIDPTHYNLACSGSGITITVDPALLQRYDGRQWEVTVTGTTDFLGNVSDPAANSWQFEVDYFKQTPSSITLVGPNNWRINQATEDPTLNFLITDFDVYQESTSLNTVALQYKRLVDGKWITATEFTGAELAAKHQALDRDSKFLIDTLAWNTTSALEGSYQVRALVTGETGRTFASETVTGLIDRLAPQVLGTPQPADGVYHSGDEVSITFTEAIACEASVQYTVQVTDFGQTESTDLVPTQVQCIGDGYLFFFNEEDLREHFGGTVTVAMGNVTDLAGNTPQGEGTLSFQFTIGQMGQATSIVSLLTPTTTWQVNQAQREVLYTLGNYDVFELETTLDSVVLEFSAAHETDWQTIASVSQAELAEHYTENRATATEAPTFPILWVPSVADGQYEVRAVAYGAHGFPEYSETLGGRVDQTAPWLLSLNPGEGILQHAQSVQLTFTKAIAEASMTDEALALRERIIATPVGGGQPDTTYIKVPRAMYRIAHNGDQIGIYFDENFTITYDGATLALDVNGLTDEANNPLDSVVHTAFIVVNQTASAQRLESLSLRGEQQEDGSIALHWNHYDPVGTHGYVVERSADGQFFQDIATVQATTAYQDVVRFDDHLFYRLRVQRTDGTQKYSRVVHIQDTGLAIPLSVEIYPNPIQDRALHFSWFSKGLQAKLHVQVRDLRGVLIHQGTLDLNTRATQQTVKLPPGLESGMYLLTVTQDSQSQTIQFVVQD